MVNVQHFASSSQPRIEVRPLQDERQRHHRQRDAVHDQRGRDRPALRDEACHQVAERHAAAECEHENRHHAAAHRVAGRELDERAVKRHHSDDRGAGDEGDDKAGGQLPRQTEGDQRGGENELQTEREAAFFRRMTAARHEERAEDGSNAVVGLQQRETFGPRLKMLFATTGIIVKSGMPRKVPAKERKGNKSNDRFDATNAKPSFICAIIDADVAPACSGGILIMVSARITKPNDRPLMPKQAVAPQIPNTIPPSAGPITRARLNCIEFMATALAMSSRLTSSGSNDAYAGPLMDWALPVKNDRMKMCQILTVWK